MRFILILALLSLTFAFANGQNFNISGNVIDSDSKEELPFANIMVLHYTIGTTSDLHGFFELSLADSLKNDSLIISYVGYSSRKIAINQIKNSTIKLNPQNFQISEAIIKASSKNVKPITVNRFKKRDCMLRYSISPFDTTGNVLIPYRPSEPTIEAIFFPYKEEYSDCKRLKEVKLYVRNLKESPSYFRLRIFDVNKQNNPGLDILEQALNIEVTENQQTVIMNLEEYNISINERGLFIGFELLIIPENHSTIKNGLGKEANVYSPFLYQIKTKETGIYWIYSKGIWTMSKYWYFKQGVWFQSYKSDIKDKDTSHAFLFKPAISITLTQ